MFSSLRRQTLLTLARTNIISKPSCVAALHRTQSISVYSFIGKRQYSQSKVEEHPNSKHCWHCNSLIEKRKIVCNKPDCKHIQPLDTSNNYFDVLYDSNVTFKLDLRKLRNNFINLQQSAHPDINTNEDTDYSQNQSIWLNKAYENLKNPLLRAKYILYLKGKEIREDEKSSNPEFLFTVMDIRERIESLENSEDVKQTANLIEDLIQEKIKEMAAEYYSDIDSFREKTIELSYLYRAKDSL
ncbi:hypothetical protein BB560_001921 [Smittium megazygosporum]|uniref:J domain-containing protein n=1 Tax=Smittium megazygosporum TaxID=133381 RepID=A0A2T9ZG92_9FUNG|nr:hypothetical protein BB560_001921 [Smittium megazygosporum]